MRISKNLFLIVSVASVLILGAVIFLRPAPESDDFQADQLPPEAELQMFMNDKMDYGVKLSRILAERRLEKAEAYVNEHPELASLARETADTLRARLEREAKME
ncbi:hypothetical protein KQI65_01280 [bacterium]|nr:hypothetical protein [bacterium]